MSPTVAVLWTTLRRRWPVFAVALGLGFLTLGKIAFGAAWLTELAALSAGLALLGLLGYLGWQLPRAESSEWSWLLARPVSKVGLALGRVATDGLTVLLATWVFFAFDPEIHSEFNLITGPATILIAELAPPEIIGGGVSWVIPLAALGAYPIAAAASACATASLARAVLAAAVLATVFISIPAVVTLGLTLLDESLRFEPGFRLVADPERGFRFDFPPGETPATAHWLAIALSLVLYAGALAAALVSLLRAPSAARGPHLAGVSLATAVGAVAILWLHNANAVSGAAEMHDRGNQGAQVRLVRADGSPAMVRDTFMFEGAPPSNIEEAFGRQLADLRGDRSEDPLYVSFGPSEPAYGRLRDAPERWRHLPLALLVCLVIVRAIADPRAKRTVSLALGVAFVGTTVWVLQTRPPPPPVVNRGMGHAPRPAANPEVWKTYEPHEQSVWTGGWRPGTYNLCVLQWPDWIDHRRRNYRDAPPIPGRHVDWKNVDPATMRLDCMELEIEERTGEWQEFTFVLPDPPDYPKPTEPELP